MSARLRTAVFCLAAGCVVSPVAVMATLLVDGVTAKRIVWLALLIGGGFGIGVWGSARNRL